MSEASDSTISASESSFAWAASILRRWLRNLERSLGTERGMVFMVIES